MFKSAQPIAPFLTMLSKSIKAYFFVNALSILLLLSSQILLARLLGANNYGVYVYTLSWLSIFVLVAKLSMDTIVQRFIPQYSSKQEWGLYLGVVSRSLLITSLSACTLALLLYLFLPLFESVFEKDLTESFRIAVWIIPILSLIKIIQAIHLANKHYLLSQLADGVMAPAIIMIVTIILTIAFNISVNAQLVLQYSILIYGLSLLLILILLKGTILPLLKMNVPVKFQTRTWLITAIPILLVSGMQIILNQTDVLAIGYFMGTTIAGIYSASSRLASFISLPLTITAAALSPYIVELYFGNKKNELQQTVTLIVTISSIISAVILASLWLFGDFALSLFGKQFLAGTPSLRILTTGLIVTSLSGPTLLFMIMTSHQNIAAYILLSSTILNITLNFTLIPEYGIEGAASATAISSVYSNIALASYIYWKTRVNTTILSALG